ncbi:MAG: sigma-54 dependent transcriptional regulator [Candidatus Omnitrophota bacterium]
MQKNRVLIVTSDKLAQKSLSELLLRYGYSVDIGPSVQKSLTCLNKNAYQIILMDIMEKGSMELLRIAKERRIAAEIIVLTSYDSLDAAAESLSLGAFDYLIRPVEDKKILSVIKRALANKPSVITRPVKEIKGTMVKDSNPVIRGDSLSFTQDKLCGPGSFIAEKKILSPALSPGLAGRKEKLRGNLLPRSSKTDRLAEPGIFGLVGASPKLNVIFSLIRRIASSRSTVLLRGESGTGKRVIARAIHQADKTRRDKPFIELACGALSKGIVESELFGHIRGAFTDAVKDRKGRFELADGGTILLDDIDALSLDLQVKLLRVLQHKEFERVGDHQTIKVDVRIIAATNHNLEKAVADGEFRQDLYYRLNVIAIDIPPLRERKEDIPLLAKHFIDVYAAENSKEIKTVADALFPVLMQYNWPGNIRELENLMERAVILDADGVIDRHDLPKMLLNGDAALYSALSRPDINGFMSLKNAVEEPEKTFILQALKEAGGNKKKAAKQLGVNRTTLYNKLRKYHILSSSL